MAGERLTLRGRSQKMLERRGADVGILESYDTRAGKTKDVFGFDLIALLDGKQVWVQVTSADHVSHRVAKLLDLKTTKEILLCLGRVEVHGWSERGAKGADKEWMCRVLIGELISGNVRFREVGLTK